MKTIWLFYIFNTEAYCCFVSYIGSGYGYNTVCTPSLAIGLKLSSFSLCKIRKCYRSNALFVILLFWVFLLLLLNISLDSPAFWQIKATFWSRLICGKRFIGYSIPILIKYESVLKIMYRIDKHELSNYLKWNWRFNFNFSRTRNVFELSFYLCISFNCCVFDEDNN